jgi:hypothetical protein
MRGQGHSRRDPDRVGVRQFRQRLRDARADNLGVIVQHVAAECEQADDCESHSGRQGRVLNEAGARDWTLISQKNDWKIVLTPQK